MAAPGKGLPVGSLAETILSGVESHFAAAAVALPARRVIAPGSATLIAYDCAMLAVTLEEIGQGAAPGQGQTSGRSGVQISATMLRHVIYSVTLLRDEPSPSAGGKQPPRAEDMTRSGIALMRDAGLLSQALIEIATTMTGSLGRGSIVEAGRVEPVGPEGGLHGLTARFAATAGLLE